MRKVTLSVCALICLLTGTPGGSASDYATDQSGSREARAGATWLVNPDGTGDAPTIQAAVDAASPGDTVLCTPGIYTGEGNRDISFGGKNLVVISQGGFEHTTIDCGGSPAEPHRAFAFTGGEDTTSVVSGFTIINGYAPLSNFLNRPGGGAIYTYLYPTKPTVKNCVFENCQSESYGGAVFTLYGAAINLSNCRFENNYAQTGGAIRMQDEMGRDAQIEDCKFIGNSALGGGAVALDFSRPAFHGCLFEDNTSTGSGGAIVGLVASATFDSCVFRNNSAATSGGAMRVFESFVQGTFCLFEGNSATHGGAIWWEHPDMKSSTEGHYSLAVEEYNKVMTPGPSFSSSTFYGNHASDSGSVVFTSVMSTGSPMNELTITFSQSIMALNTGAETAVARGGLRIPEFYCSNLYGNEMGDWSGQIADQAAVNDNFSADPLFCDPISFEFTLDILSPCLADNSPCAIQVGAYGLGCFPRETAMVPDYLYLFQAYSVETVLISILTNEFPEPYSPADVDVPTLNVNGGSVPIHEISVLTDWPVEGLDALNASIAARDIILPLGFLYDTTVHPFALSGEFTDATPFEVSGSFRLIGHRSGDINFDGAVDISDLVVLVDFFYHEGTPPRLEEIGDVNRDNSTDIGDLIALVGMMF